MAKKLTLVRRLQPSPLHNRRSSTMSPSRLSEHTLLEMDAIKMEWNLKFVILMGIFFLIQLITGKFVIPLFYPKGVKVVMSVAVEGSPGPVKVMVQLGASVEEMITIVIEKYGSEGRSPRLNLEATPYFELHHSQFTLQSLKKSDKIGEVGGRSFYLRTNSSCSNHGLNLGIETSYNCFYPDAIIEIDQLPEDHKSSAISSSHPFLATSAISFNKIERRTKRICKLVACFLCV